MPRPRLHINHKIICTALLLVSLIPIVVAATAMVRHWAPLPYWDEWFTPGEVLRSYAQGTLSFTDFFLQHNESRKVFPRLLYLALAKLHGWDVRDGMVVTLLEVATICGLCFLLFLRTTGATAKTALVALAATTFLAFFPIQYENFLWGLQFEPFFPGLAVILVALINLSPLRFGTKTLLNLVIALVATYTFANGMLLWIFGIPLPAMHDPASKRRRLIWYVLFASVGVGAISGYFVDYQRPVYHPSFHFGIGQIIRYVILWVGGYFKSAHISPFVVGVTVLILWLVTSASAIILITRGTNWRHFYSWFVIGIYALISSIITAIGRLGFGVEQALSPRYTTFSLFSYLGLIGMTFALYCYFKDKAIIRGRRCIVAVTVTAFTLVTSAWILSYRTEQQFLAQISERNSRLLCALEWINLLPTNPDLKQIFPHINLLRSRANILARAKLLRCHLVSPHILDRLKNPIDSTTSSHGRLEVASMLEKSLVASGWAWLADTGAKPNCVVIGLRKPNKQLELLSVAALSIPRPDIDRHYGEQTMKPFGFWSKTPISIPAEGLVEAWAVDTNAEIAWPLAGTIPLHD
jgi:hypothetical protein